MRSPHGSCLTPVRAPWRLLWPCALLVSLSACASTGPASRPAVDLGALPGLETFPKADRVILEESDTIRFHSPGDGAPVADHHHFERYRVLTNDARKSVMGFAHYNRTFEEVRDFEVRLVTAKGVQVWDEGDAGDVPAFPSWTLYSDSRAIAVDVDSRAKIPLGAVVEVEWTVRHRDPRLFAFGTWLGNSEPTVLAKLEVILPRGFEMRVARRDGEAASVAVVEGKVEEGETTRHSWVQRDHPGFEVESRGPGFRYHLHGVQVQLARWQEDGAWQTGFATPEELSVFIDGFVKPAATVSPALEQVVAEQLSGAESAPAADKARRLYNWVQDTVRYCAVQVGYGGWRPHESTSTLKAGYGDCKDKANLLAAALSVVGIESRLVGIGSHDGFPMAFGVPTMVGNFNHMILEVLLPDGPVLADPTTRSTPFGWLPPNDQGAPYLAESPEGEPLKTSPWMPASANVRTERYDLTVPTDGQTAQGTFELVYRGEYGASLRSRILAEGDVAEAVRDTLGMRDVETRDVSISGHESTVWAGTLKGEGKLKASGAVSGSGRTRVIRLGGTLGRVLPRLGEEARKTPLKLTHLRTIEQTVRFRLPEGWDVSQLPDPVELKQPFATYSLRWTHEDGLVKAVRRSTRDAPMVEAASYPALLGLSRAIEDAEQRAVLLRCPTCTAEGG